MKTKNIFVKRLNNISGFNQARINSIIGIQNSILKLEVTEMKI